MIYNPLQYLFNKYPNKFKNVAGEYVFENPNATQDLIKNNLNLNTVDWSKISYCGFYKYYTKPEYYQYENYWYANFKQKHSLDMIKMSLNDNWKVYLYSSFVKENIDKYPIKHFLSMDMSVGNIDDILYILRKYPHPDWKMDTISKNSKLTIPIVKSNMDIKWNWGYLSYNSNITMDDIKDNLDIPWDWRNILHNPNISIEIFGLFKFKRLIKKFKYNIFKFGQPMIKSEIMNYIIHNYKTNKINYVKFSDYVTIETLKRYPNKEWGWDLVSTSNNITLKDIKTNIHLPWDFYNMSSNPNLTIEFVKKYINKPWNWDRISSNSNINMKDIENNSKLPWNFKYISLNPNLTVDFIEKNIDKHWNWNRIARNHFITDIRINALNRIGNRWKERNNRYIMEHKYRLKSVKAELETLQPSKTDNFDFKGGITYIEALGHFNSIKN